MTDTTSRIDATTHDTPRVTSMRVIPIAGRDGMLLNLSGARPSVKTAWVQETTRWPCSP